MRVLVEGKPDYFESHVANCRLTSSCGIVSPRSIWSTPLRMAARNSTRSAMTSRLAFSGKRSMESKASCLSLMLKDYTSRFPPQARVQLAGRIVKTIRIEFALELEEKGYDWILKAA